MRRTTWRSGTPDVKGTPDGWLNRYLAAKDTCAECELPASPFRAVAFAQQTPRILEGPAPTIAMSSLDDFSDSRDRHRCASGSRRSIAPAPRT